MSTERRPVHLLRSRLRPRSRPRFAGLSFNRMMPNILTLFGLCAGLSAMRYGLEARFGAAAVAVVVAACIDGLDGRLARLLKATSRFGAEFDSMTDFCCFGVAPAFVLYLWSLQAWGGLGFTPCVLFAVCMALRLARFNAAIEAPPPIAHAYAYNFFTGVPAPCGAGLVLFPLFLGLEGRTLGLPGVVAFAHNPVFCFVVLVGTATLLVSTLPVWSFKNFKVPKQLALPLLLGVGTFTALLVAEPWAALAGAGVIYLGTIVLSRQSFRRLRAAAEARTGAE